MKKEFKIRIAWTGQDGHWWNETCISVMEVFGLPGDRFTWHPYPNYMEFNFSKEKDAELCKILLSDKL